MFLTDHRLGIYTTDFSRHPVELEVHSSITISPAVKPGLDSRSLYPTGPKTMHLKKSSETTLGLPELLLHLVSQQHNLLHPKDYLQICINEISYSSCAHPRQYAVLAGDFNSVWDPILGRTLGAHGKGLQTWARDSSWRHPTSVHGLGDSALEQVISHFSRMRRRGQAGLTIC